MEFTGSEMRVIKYLAYPTKQIAKKANFQPCTVNTYLESIYTKLEVNTRGLAILKLLSMQIVTLDYFDF